MDSATIDAGMRFVVGEQRRSLHARGGWPGLSSQTGLARRWWTERLQRALREGLFVVHYQPVVAIASGEISHHEALVRLRDGPRGGLLAPGLFLPAAERYGLVQEIDRMVLGKAIAVMGGPLRDRPGPGRLSLSRPEGPAGPVGVIRVAVNLSARSVTDAGMLSYIADALARHGVNPGRLVIEITETSAIEDMERARAFCERLQAMGCAVALDDFGVGFGSFRYVKHLPFKFLKIDGDFVRMLPRSARDELVVRALVGVARGLGKQTIAEYVGDEPTLELLGRLGVDYAQGYGLGRPRAAAEAFLAVA